MARGEVALSNVKPDSDWPGAGRAPAPAFHWIAKPSVAPAWVVIALQPAGSPMSDGMVGMKSLPGTQANQNVPRSVVPVSFNVRLYCQDVGDSSIDESVALAASDAAAGAAAQAHATATAARAMPMRCD